MTADHLLLERVHVGIGGRTLIGPLDLDVAPGECVTLMGRSGCGKSTLLAWLAGTIDPTFDRGGRVAIGATDLTALAPEQRRVGILFQDDLLFPHLSIGGNLAFALPASIRGRHERRARVEQALSEADLQGFADRDPATLSGGQRARAALMRTLVAEPRALLLDEPFNKLDAQLREEIRSFVFQHVRDRKLPMLLVTHDEADGRAAGGRVIRVDGGRSQWA